METTAVGLELSTAVAPLQPSRAAGATKFDRHAGVRETSSGLYLFPSLVDMNKAVANDIALPEHLQSMLPQVMTGDSVLSQLFLAEALKPMETGKHTSTTRDVFNGRVEPQRHARSVRRRGTKCGRVIRQYGGCVDRSVEEHVSDSSLSGTSIKAESVAMLLTAATLVSPAWQGSTEMTRGGLRPPPIESPTEAPAATET